MTVADPMPQRPPVSIIIPFAGEEEDARGLISALEAVELRTNDEIVVADNSQRQVFSRASAGSRIEVVVAVDESSAYHARNVAVASSTGEWLLFTDSDCRPAPSVLDDFFARAIDSRVGLVSGLLLPHAGDSLMGQYAATRFGDRTASYASHPYRPYGITANLLVLRRAFEQVGGFQEGIRSGGDVDLCWRIQDAGWGFARHPEAVIRHVERQRLTPLLRVTARYGAGRRWLVRSHPGCGVRPTALRRLARCAIGAPGWIVRGQPRRGVLKLIDGTLILAELAGYYCFSNSPRRNPKPAPERPAASLVLLCDQFPARSETFVLNEVLALRRAGARVRVEAQRHPDRPAFGAPGSIDVTWNDTEGVAGKLADTIALAVRRPFACLRDLSSRHRWRRQEPVMPLRAIASAARRIRTEKDTHVHAHFAHSPALNAMRLSRLTGRPYSVMVHGFDVYRSPANLEEKLAGAAFVGIPCTAIAADIAEIAPGAAEHLERIVMGVDEDQFRRTRPYDGGGRVLAIGRLIEKKGFSTLLEATSLLAGVAVFEGLTIVGDGPLMQALRRQAEGLGLEHSIRFAGAARPEQIRDLLEDAALLACPSVIANDGDRDTMPVVAKEALAMEVPVVASDLVGLPELVDGRWGRLVSPGDPRELAEAISELLSLKPSARAEMGKTGRQFVVRECSVDHSARQLIDLIRACGSSR
jgi:glycosyltransferase involved in cell wall biosynthesis/GT2 family glycosyltransferase